MLGVSGSALPLWPSPPWPVPPCVCQRQNEETAALRLAPCGTKDENFLKMFVNKFKQEILEYSTLMGTFRKKIEVGLHAREVP